MTGNYIFHSRLLGHLLHVNFNARYITLILIPSPSISKNSEGELRVLVTIST